jgi:hypothetical protein
MNSKIKKGSRIFEATIKSVSPGGKLIVHHAIEEEFDLEKLSGNASRPTRK